MQAGHAYAMVEVVMTDLDHMLETMRRMPADHRLDGMESSVFKGMERRREQSASRRSMVLAGVLALGIGWAGSTVPSAPAQASVTLIGMSDYAPSRVLGQ